MTDPGLDPLPDRKKAAKDHKQNSNVKSGPDESFISIKFPGWITVCGYIK